MKLSSPFRYPGAKSRIIDIIFNRFGGRLNSRKRFVDVFTGGGSVFLSIDNLTSPRRIIVNDKDEAVSAFWKCMTDEDGKNKIVSLIENTKPTLLEHSVQRKNISSEDLIKRAFACIFLNRTSFSGILTAGPIGGGMQNKYAVDCRYNPKALVRKINDIYHCLHHKTDVFDEDFESVIERYDEDDVCIYVDSPYYVKGNQLYRETMDDDDHIRLSESLKGIKKASVVISYDKAPFIEKLYQDYFFVDDLSVRYSIQGDERKGWNAKDEIVISNIPIVESNDMFEGE